MLREVFQKLDHWIQEENKDRQTQGTLLLKKTIIRVLGQTALLEAKLKIELLGTADVDAYIEGDYIIRKKFNELLSAQGRFLDTDSEKIWMPQETQYQLFYNGEYVGGFLAYPEYVLISKALKAPQKNKSLIVEYLANQPSKEFFKMAKKYHIDLEKFV